MLDTSIIVSYACSYLLKMWSYRFAQNLKKERREKVESALEQVGLSTDANFQVNFLGRNNESLSRALVSQRLYL